MGLIIIFGGLGGVFIILVSLAIYFVYQSDTLDSYNSDWWENWAFSFGLISATLLVVLVIGVPVTFIGQYSASINLPEKYYAYDRAIQVTKEMLIESGQDVSIDDLDFGNIGKGLEGLKAKNSIYAMIEKREQIAREIKFRQRNVFVFFKPKLVR